MDNVIQVLVFIFIIWSILGSAFKKKPQNSQKLPNRNSGEGSGKPSPKYSKTSQDVLEEILGFKIPQQNSDYPQEINYESENLDKSSKDLETDLPDTYSQSEYSSIPDINYDKQPSLETAESKSLRVDIHKQYSEKVFMNYKSAIIKKKLTNKSSFRDAVLITEILNKPKALRK